MESNEREGNPGQWGRSEKCGKFVFVEIKVRKRSDPRENKSLIVPKEVAVALPKASVSTRGDPEYLSLSPILFFIIYSPLHRTLALSIQCCSPGFLQNITLIIEEILSLGTTCNEEL